MLGLSTVESSASSWTCAGQRCRSIWPNSVDQCRLCGVAKGARPGFWIEAQSRVGLWFLEWKVRRATTSRDEVVERFRRGLRLTVGFRDDLYLPRYWWHRLWQVGIVVTACFLFGWVFLTEARSDPLARDGFIPLTSFPEPTPWHPETAFLPAAVVTASYVIIAANLYYRGFVYIVKGPRGS
jgi:hypothetical protein